MSDLTKSTAVARINNVDIVVIENGEKRVAVKPICEALGVDFSAQLQRLKTDPILSSTVGIIPTVGGDGKDREMVTIPFKFVFGWLFLIDSRKVKEEARDAVMCYQLECYNALYNHFILMEEYFEERGKRIAKAAELLEDAREEFRESRKRVDDGKLYLREQLGFSLEIFKAEKLQTAMVFPADE